TKSAILSSIVPNLLVEFVFLAIYPSIISLNPHIEYTIQNEELNGSKKNKIGDNKILVTEMILGNFFIPLPRKYFKW
ncbi:MAG: hypothetical protein K0R18_1780, partial [Bacillales bacterium]|nr:hypothetical protein [Bacillales bacterium]